MTSRSVSSSLLALVLPVSFAGAAHAASLTYDADTATTGAQDGSGAGWNTDAGNTGFWNGSANVVWPNTTADDITFGAGSGAAGSVTVGTVNTNKITFGAAGSGNYALTGGTIALGGTAPGLVVNSDASIASGLAGTVGFTKTGNGALTLSGAQTYNGAITLNGGSVSFTGTAASTATNNAILIGGTGSRTAMQFNSSGTFTYGTTAGNTRIGGNDAAGDTGTGSVAQTSGNVTFARNGSYLELGTNTGATPTAYGSYLLSGGSFTTTVNGGMRVGNGGMGSFVQTGGTANIGRWLAIGGSTAAAASSNGVVTLTGGSLTVNSGFRAILGDRQSASGTLNIGTLAGGNAVMTTANNLGLYMLGATNALNATVNLNPGTLALGGPINRQGAVVGSNATVNLNGGTLQPTANSVTLISNANALTANVYNGGLKVDTQGFTSTISAPLLATTGNGIYPAGGVLNQPSATGTGYIGAPLVSITTSGAGAGATAVANVANGQVTGVTLTCPGQGYNAGDTVTFTFAGGGSTAAAAPFAYVLTAADLAANGTGGLTKLGSGTLNMTGANTFNGPVSITGNVITSNLTLNNTTLAIHGFNPLAPTPQLQVNTAFTTGGTVPVQVDGTFSPGNWPLIYYPAGVPIGGSGISALQLQTGSLPRGVVATLVDNNANGSVDLSVTSFNPLTWKGNVSQAWDINTTSNWTIGGAAQKYLEGDLVLFNDNATGSNTEVTLNTTVLPQSVSFDNFSKNYTLKGTGSIGGNAPITKSNIGTLTILNNNTSTGALTISGGTVQFGDGTSNGSVAGPLVNNGNVVFNPAGAGTVAASELSGDGTGFYTKTGSGTQVLINAVNSYPGTFQVNEGTLQFGNVTTNGALGGATYTLAAGTTLRVDSATAGALPWGTITGSGKIELNSAQAVNGSAGWGSLTLPAEFTGVLKVEKGRVEAGGGSSATGGASKVQILPGAQFLAFTSATPYTTPIEIAGTGWGENGYPGGLRLAGGATATWAGSVTLTADSGIMAQRTANFTVTGAITGAYLCEFYAGDPVGDSGTLTITPTVPGQNTYAATKINGRPNGSVVAGSDQAFSTGPLTVDSAILKLNGHSHSFANLSGAGGTIGNYSTATPATLTVGDSSNTSYAGTLSNGAAAPLALTKTGTGTLTLTAATSYTGNTTVSQGKLALATASLADTSTVTIASGAVLELDSGTSDTIASLNLGGTTFSSGVFNSSHPVYGAYFAGTGSLVVGAAGYDAWAASKGLDGTPGKEKGATDDPDKDGIQNLAEFYLDGNPLANDQGILPVATLDASYLTLSFKRRDDAELDVASQAIQYGTNVAAWTDVSIGALSSTSGAGVIVTVTENADAPDTITVQIPRTLNLGGKLFARLNVTK